MHGTRWLIVVSILCLCFLAGSIGGVAGFFTDSETSTGNCFQAWTSRLWTQTTQSDFEAGIPVQADTLSSPGDVGLAWDDGVFALQGGTRTFWRYGVPGNSWASMTRVSNAVGDGGALAYDGSRYIYAFRGGGNSRTFWRYDTTANSWMARANTPAGIPVGAGGALACYGSTYVYAFPGGGTNRTFLRYSVSGNTWATMASWPNGLNRNVGAGAALAYDGSRYIYALQGNTRTAFWRYDTTSDSWAAMTAAPSSVAAGGALAYDGSGYIYGFRGNGTATFWRYSISGNTWMAMTGAPGNVGAGGALAYGRFGYIYAFGGNGSNAFWRYDVSGNSWMAMTSAPGNINAGGALAFVRATRYVASATVASQVFDTGVAGDAWDAQIWDETLPSSDTDITFEVRADDTAFNADDALLPWTAVGGTMPLGAALPAGQYKQWRATLTTSNTAVTPLLHEVRLYYR